MNRFGAFLIHLGISLVIFAVLAAIVVYVWYPDFFFASDGGWQGIRIIALVDLVLGPLLTLVVFNKSKPFAELRRDLTIIGTFQAACLMAGVFVVYMERPLALVYVDGHFFSMSADDYTDRGLEVPDLSDLPGPYPKRVVVGLPEDVIEQSEIRRMGLSQGVPLRAMGELYEPLAYERLNLADEAVDVEALMQREDGRQKIEAWLAEHGGELADYGFLPFGARYEYLFLGVSREEEEVVGLLDLPRIPGERAEAEQEMNSG